VTSGAGVISDVVIVGGGAAGMTAALYLARFRRSVVIVDANRSRLARIPLSHNYPGFAQGVAGATLHASLRAQLDAYPVQWCHDEAASVEPTDDSFAVHCASGRMAQGRLLLLATGVTDVAPDAPHMSEALRQGLLRYCPVCDGYEVIDRAVGVYGRSASVVAEAAFLRHFTSRVTVFLEDGAKVLAGDALQRLQRAQVRLVEAPVSAIFPDLGRITVTHGDDASVCDTLYCALGLQVHNDVALQLGATCDADGYVQVDAHGATSVRGLYAAGDLTQGLNQIAVATGNAAIAAAAMHRELLARAVGMPAAGSG
jgi:thioredoxin reductase (NADPH)